MKYVQEVCPQGAAESLSIQYICRLVQQLIHTLLYWIYLNVLHSGTINGTERKSVWCTVVVEQVGGRK